MTFGTRNYDEPTDAVAWTREPELLVALRETSPAAEERFVREAPEAILDLCGAIEDLVDDWKESLDTRIERCVDYVTKTLDPHEDIIDCAIFLRDFETLLGMIAKGRSEDAERKLRGNVVRGPWASKKRRAKPVKR